MEVIASTKRNLMHRLQFQTCDEWGLREGVLSHVLVHSWRYLTISVVCATSFNMHVVFVCPSSHLQWMWFAVRCADRSVWRWTWWRTSLWGTQWRLPAAPWRGLFRWVEILVNVVYCWIEHMDNPSKACSAAWISVIYQAISPRCRVFFSLVAHEHYTDVKLKLGIISNINVTTTDTQFSLWQISGSKF